MQMVLGISERSLDTAQLLLMGLDGDRVLRHDGSQVAKPLLLGSDGGLSVGKFLVADRPQMEGVQVGEELLDNLSLEAVNRHRRLSLTVGTVAGVDALRATSERRAAQPAPTARTTRQPGEQVGASGGPTARLALGLPPQRRADNRLVRAGLDVLTVADLAQVGPTAGHALDRVLR